MTSVDSSASAARQAAEDDDLVERLRAGDEGAFVQIVDAWSGGMRRVAASYVGSMASAEDVVQDAWLAVIEHLAAFEGRSSLKHWVFRIVANTAKRRAARDSRVVPVDDLTGDDGPAVEPSRFRGAAQPFPGHWREPPAPWPSPEEAAEAVEVRRVVSEAVERLPPRQAAVITLRDIEGYPADEAADLMGISTANQRVLLHRGRAAVRAALAEYLSAGVTDRRRRDSGKT